MKHTVTAMALCAAAASSAGATISTISNVRAPAFIAIRGGSLKESSSNSTAAGTNKPSKRKQSAKKSSEESTEKNQELSPQDLLLQDIMNQSDYYAILGISKSASPREITKAYRKRAVQTHPDKIHGDRRAFDKVAEAHGVLSDEAKRSTYDRYGKRGLEQPHQNSEDLFRSFFGGPSQHMRQRRNRNVKYQLEVTLEELYCGLTRTILVEQLGSQQQQQHQKSVQVHIPRGMANGETIVLSGEMDAISDATPGDLLFLLAQRQHAVFTRKGHDLAVELEVTLSEAMCGFQGTIQHLDGRVLTISSAREQGNESSLLIHTGDVHVLKGEGMPKRDTGAFGDLYVQYVVKLPSATALQRLSVEERAQLKILLEKLEDKTHNENDNVEGQETIVLQKANPADFGIASGVFQMQQDESQEDERQSGARSFYWSSSSRSSNNPFSGQNPFFGGSAYNGQNDNVQCQQM